MSTALPRIATMTIKEQFPQTSVPVQLETLLEYLKGMVNKGGPDPNEYSTFTSSMETLARFQQTERWSEKQISWVRTIFGEALSTQTIQGWALHKPHGYAGDFEIIEKIYKSHISPNPQLSNWDRFFQTHSAAKAVRNRISYFLEQLWKVKTELSGQAQVLNLASGPGRDMYESMKVIGHSNVLFDCVDQDLNAIHYARSLCQDYLSNITFLHCNAFRFVAKKKYHLIWSAGLFDYFSDRVFKRLLKRLLPNLAKNGKLVIGNFSEDNPSRAYMEFFDWILHHRSGEKLCQLAKECGVAPKNIFVDQEPEGVNIFLHIVNA